jgi:hypothetical protein
MGGENGLLEVAGGRMDGGREERSGGFGGAGRGKRMDRGAESAGEDVLRIVPGFVACTGLLLRILQKKLKL